MDSIFLVIGEVGDYDTEVGDYDTYGTWAAKAFKYEDAAAALARKLNNIIKEFFKDKKGNRLNSSTEQTELIALLIEGGDPNPHTALLATLSYDWDEVPFEEEFDTDK